MPANSDTTEVGGDKFESMCAKNIKITTEPVRGRIRNTVVLDSSVSVNGPALMMHGFNRYYPPSLRNHQ